tara:strand:- start:101 stop:313 length:213 start_codon:yes stop_codon:yes gene_type:complete
MDSKQARNLNTTGARRFLKAEFGRIGGSEVPLAYCIAKLAELEAEVASLKKAAKKPAPVAAAKPALKAKK